MISQRAYPGIYMAFDPRPGSARVTVEGMLSLAGRVADRALAGEESGCAVVAVSPPGEHPEAAPIIHSSPAGTLVWAGEMFPPENWSGAGERPSSQRLAAVVLDRLGHQGPEVLGDIDGSFCGAWFSSDSGTWTIFNDRWGLIPLFWWADGRRLIISPKARITWRASGSDLRIDGNGVADLLRTQNMLDDHTLIENVRWLMPATCLRWDGRGVSTRQYWDYQHRARHAGSYEEVIDSFVDVSRSTMARIIDTPAPVMQGLSGGLDSRMFLAVCQELGRMPECYTSGLVWSEDVRFGRKLARAAGTGHETLLLDADCLPDQLRSAIIETDGLHGAAHLVTSAPITPYLAHHAGAVLLEGYLHGGLGGSKVPADQDVGVSDSVCGFGAGGQAASGTGGQSGTGTVAGSTRPAHTHAWALNLLHTGGNPGLIGGMLREELAADSLRRWQAHVDDAFAHAPSDDPLCRAEYAVISGRSGRNDVLVPAMFRRHVLVRQPGCNRRMIDWYASTPASLRRGRQVCIDALRRHYPQFARLPRADGCSGMPLTDHRWLREYRWRIEKLYSRWARLRYSDVRRWGRDSLAIRAWTFEACRQANLFAPVLAADARVLEWVRPQAVRDLWQTVCRDPRRSIPLLNLLTIELMVRELERMPATERSESPLAFRPLKTPARSSREHVEVS